MMNSRTSEVNHLEEFDMRAFFQNMWKSRLAVVVITATVTLLAAAYSMTLTPIYTARVTILPQQQSSSSSGIFGQVMGMTGLGLSGASDSHEDLYARILTSDRILDTTISRTWKTSGQDATLFDVFNISADPASHVGALQLKGILRSQVISFSRDKLTGYMELRISVPNEPELAAELANFLITQLEQYNQSFKRNKATAQRQFIEDRVGEHKAALEEVENKLTNFIKSNRTYNSSPVLVLEFNRLNREVQAFTSVWVELRKQLEVAKIDENKEMVSLDVLDMATAPIQRSSPNRSKLGLIGIILGFSLSIVWVVARK